MSHYCQPGYVEFQLPPTVDTEYSAVQTLSPMSRVKDTITANSGAIRLFLRQPDGRKEEFARISARGVEALKQFGKVDTFLSCAYCSKRECVEKGDCDDCGRTPCQHAVSLKREEARL